MQLFVGCFLCECHLLDGGGVLLQHAGVQALGLLHALAHGVRAHGAQGDPRSSGHAGTRGLLTETAIRELASLFINTLCTFCRAQARKRERKS